MKINPHKPTIKDIARDLNVSVSTVSRALRGMPDVNPQTMKEILRHAEKIDYQPNMAALSLVKKQTHTIGVIVPNLDYFCANAIRGIDEAALEAGYTVMICQSNESYGREVVNTQRLMSSSVDGLIVSLSNESNNIDHFKNLQEINLDFLEMRRDPELDKLLSAFQKGFSGIIILKPKQTDKTPMLLRYAET